mgnify:CR=1 FL=1
MAWLPVCTDCGPLTRTNILADAKGEARVHEQRHAEEHEPPSRFALCCPHCPWFYEPRTIVLVKNAGFRALILDQHLLVCST